MAEQKHTPGPWAAMRFTRRWSILDRPSFDDGTPPPLAQTCSVQNKAKEKANAHLIAAAPDMFEALSNLENDNGANMPPSAWKLVQDALAKARGEA